MWILISTTRDVLLVTKIAESVSTSHECTYLLLFLTPQCRFEFRNSAIKTLQDLIQYKNKFKNAQKSWCKICSLWDEAMMIYSELLNETGIIFTVLLEYVNNIMKKPLSINFKLSELQGHMSVNETITHIHSFMHRTCTESLASAQGFQKSTLNAALHRLDMMHNLAMEILSHISKNCDFVDWKVIASACTGPTGLLRLSLRDILAQMPIQAEYNVSKAKNVSSLPLVPFIINFSPEENGEIVIGIYSSVGMNADNSFKAKSNLNIEAIIEHNSEAQKAITDFSGNMKGISSMDISAFETKTNNQNRKSLNEKKKRVIKQIPSYRETIVKLLQVPSDDFVSTIFVITAMNPQISFILDRAAIVLPGMELFSIALGPQDRLNLSGIGDTDDRSTTYHKETVDEDSEVGVGCPIQMQTGHGVKLLSQIPKAQLEIDIMGFLNFLLSHFQDLGLLRNYLGRVIHVLIYFFFFLQQVTHFYMIESLCGVSFPNEELIFYKYFLELIEKYVKLPNFNVFFNVHGKLVVTRDSEIVVTVNGNSFSSITPNKGDAVFVDDRTLVDTALVKANIFVEEIIGDYYLTCTKMMNIWREVAKEGKTKSSIISVT